MMCWAFCSMSVKLTVGRYIRHVLPVLEKAGQASMRLPDPGRKRRRKLPDLVKAIPELAVVVDTFEQAVQRPKHATGVTGLVQWQEAHAYPQNPGSR